MINRSLFNFRGKLDDRLSKNGSLNNNKTEIDDLNDYILGWPISRDTCIIIYAVFSFSILVAMYIWCTQLTSFFMKTSKNLHKNMFNAIIKSTMHFFYTNSSGECLI